LGGGLGGSIRNHGSSTTDHKQTGKHAKTTGPSHHRSPPPLSNLARRDIAS
jgi:hypothetical protein